MHSLGTHHRIAKCPESKTLKSHAGGRQNKQRMGVVGIKIDVKISSLSHATPPRCVYDEQLTNEIGKLRNH